jgi:hypothetical protein
MQSRDHAAILPIRLTDLVSLHRARRRINLPIASSPRLPGDPRPVGAAQTFGDMSRNGPLPTSRRLTILVSFRTNGTEYGHDIYITKCYPAPAARPPWSFLPSTAPHKLSQASFPYPPQKQLSQNLNLTKHLPCNLNRMTTIPQIPGVAPKFLPLSPPRESKRVVLSLVLTGEPPWPDA